MRILKVITNLGKGQRQVRLGCQFWRTHPVQLLEFLMFLFRKMPVTSAQLVVYSLHEPANETFNSSLTLLAIRCHSQIHSHFSVPCCNGLTQNHGNETYNVFSFFSVFYLFFMCILSVLKLYLKKENWNRELYSAYFASWQTTIKGLEWEPQLHHL